ncbi:hypothetical protein JZ751_026067 [Albula glossodonta]|uniref:Uncharacterized protein n=1 Tax=Albula glossodonta TaxID=121402 RepID=A0A8T2NKU4_9TELE|nr:hypothetical protein JZ751_026067 [Albula glossodonta]
MSRLLSRVTSVYFFPPLDPPWTGSRCANLLPPASLIEPTCDAESPTPSPQPPQLRRRHPLKPLDFTSLLTGWVVLEKHCQIQ